MLTAQERRELAQLEREPGNHAPDLATAFATWRIQPDPRRARGLGRLFRRLHKPRGDRDAR